MSHYISNARMQRVDQHWQATNAVICGDVALGADCSIWFGASIRGDVAPITLGHAVNVQESAVLHCDYGQPLVIGDRVTIGHGAVVHCASVGEGTLIGMKAVILGGAVVGKNCIVAAGAVVSPGMVVPDGQTVMGVPAKVVRPVREAELADMKHNNEHYIELARQHADAPEKMYR
jgi:carbonic anhydrase/acetyltransferase-like protein (isoleucine patch superfamily)